MRTLGKITVKNITTLMELPTLMHASFSWQREKEEAGISFQNVNDAYKKQQAEMKYMYRIEIGERYGKDYIRCAVVVPER